MTDLATLVSSLKVATDIAKLLKDSDLSYEKAEMKLKLSELIGALADAKIEMADVQGLLQEKDAAIKHLQDKMSLDNSFVFERPFYWRIISGEKDGPYCQKCFDADKKHIHLQGGNNDFWICLECDSTYDGPNYVDPEPPEVFTRGAW